MSDKKESKFKENLTPEQFQVCWNQGTERAFTGKYWDSKEEGTYCCVCCEKPLFSSQSKFDSGTGWPSFFQPVSAEAVKLKVDSAHGMERIEVTCGNCGAHLGHVFDDGPAPTFKRYCMNSVALDLKKSE